MVVAIRILVLGVLMMSHSISAQALLENLPACGEGPRDLPTLRWSTVVTLEIDSPFLHDQALLCLGADDQGSAQAVIYRDRHSSRHWSVEELKHKRKVVLHSEDIDVPVVRQGPLMSLGISSINVQGEEQIFDLEFRFVRNMARIGAADRRQWKQALRYHHRLGQVRPAGERQFDHLNLRVTAGAVVKSMEMVLGGQVQAEVATKTFPEVDEI